MRDNHQVSHTQHPPPQQTPDPSNINSKCITSPYSFLPQHDTAPPLDTAQLWLCKQHVINPPHRLLTICKPHQSTSNLHKSNRSNIQCKHKQLSRNHQPRSSCKTMLTPPDATIATPLLRPTTATGVSRLVVEPSPICARQSPSQPHTASSPATNTRPLKHQLKRHHLATIVDSPARHRAAARYRTGMPLHHKSIICNFNEATHIQKSHPLKTFPAKELSSYHSKGYKMHT